MNRGIGAAQQILVLLAALLLTAAGTASAQVDVAGRFIVVTGDVRIVGRDGVARVAARDDVIRQGESILTGANSLVQLRMTDGGALSVRQDTELKLDSYRYSGGDDRDASFFMSIVKGGLRTITGLIGRTRRDAYRISTPSATMGIRGTHFEVVHLVQPAADAQPGTYNRVYDGIVTFRNRLGNEVIVSRDQTGFVALPGNLAPVLVKPPVGVFGRPTPVPTITPQSRQGEGQAGADKPPASRAGDVQGAKDQTVAPASGRTLAPAQAAPLLNPIDTPTTVSPARTVSPTLVSPTTTISPVQTAPLLTPIDSPTTTTTTISPTTTTISPSLSTTISPTTTTTIAPTTTTTSPTLISPTTTTISPTTTTTTIAPTTTTISPTLSTTIAPTTTTTTISPTTTTISPTTTTIQTAPTTSTIIKR